MKVGILSDSHDKRNSASRALALFLCEGVSTVLHLGDVCSPAVLEPFREASIPILGVFGNNDFDRHGLQSVSANGFHRGPRILEIGGRKILMSHAFDELHGEIGEKGRFDLVLFGHTHRSLTMRIGKAVVINPGEACGFMSGRPTCAVADLGTMEVRILSLDGNEAGGSGDSASGAASGG